MKKRIISVIAVLAMLCGPAMMQSVKAQNIFEDEVELKINMRGGTTEEEENLISINDRDGDISLDNFAPLSGGILVLGCLGGAYLIGKRRKE